MLFLIMGIAVSLYNLYVIVAYPVIAEVNCNIVYALPQFHSIILIAFYLAATKSPAAFEPLDGQNIRFPGVGAFDGLLVLPLPFYRSGAFLRRYWTLSSICILKRGMSSNRVCCLTGASLSGRRL